MPVLSDSIEMFIKQMLEDGYERLNRNELAEHFECAPSHINYVINTRFTPERGYLTESRRGGGGFIRVIRLSLDKTSRTEIIRGYLSKGELSGREAEQTANMLTELGIADEKQARLMLAACSDRALAFAGEYKEKLRCSIIKCMINELLADN